MNLFKRFILCVIILTSYSMSSCFLPDNGVGKLAEKLFSSFIAEVDYTLTSSDGEISGNARISKANTTKIEILSPEPYDGLSIESDSSGAPSIISFQYSGIQVDFGPEAFSKLNLAFTLLSPEMPVLLGQLTRERVEELEDEFVLPGLSEIEPVRLSFQKDDDLVSFIYDKKTGTPLVFQIQGDSISLIAKVTKIKFV